MLRMDVNLVSDFGAVGAVLPTTIEAFPDSVPVPTSVGDGTVPEMIGITTVPPSTVVMTGAQFIERGSTTTEIVLEFHDVGNPDIVLEAPDGATELDGVG